MATILFMMFFIAALETTAHGNGDTPKTEEPPAQEEPDMCVGCDSKKEEQSPEQPSPVIIDIVVDPLTGKIEYVIRGIEIK